jgi:protein-S-isoprenylcysteine O-methyltransferase Ste14
LRTSGDGVFSLPMSKFTLNIVLTIGVGAALAVLSAEHSPAGLTWMQTLGMCLLVAGFVLWTVARFQLGASLTVTAQARQLMSAGIYARIRNPIYVFGSCVIVGFILVSGRPIWLLIVCVIFPFQIWRAGIEARVLEEKFWGPVSRLPGWNLVLIAGIFHLEAD